MAVSGSTVEQISGSHLNLSKSKMLWTFSKTPRFSQKKSFYSDALYELPPVRTMRGAGIGFGRRQYFQTPNKGPDPTAYMLKTHLDSQLEKKKGCSFGIARSFYDKVYCKGQPTIQKDFPGPGQYDVLKDMGSTGASRYTMRSKTQSTMELMLKNKVPGPGSYQHPPAIDPKGHQNWSKYESSKSASFNPPSSQRFFSITKSLSPGPGAYAAINTLPDNGYCPVSNYGSAKTRSFGKEFRTSQNHGKTFLKTPGPGTYRLPSEFGHYDPIKLGTSQSSTKLGQLLKYQ